MAGKIIGLWKLCKHPLREGERVCSECSLAQKPPVSILPRPLVSGEFYCHPCQVFESLENRAAHVKQHEKQR